MSRGLLAVIQCPDTRRMMRAALDAGWEWVGYTKSGHVEIWWPATGVLLHCATTPSDRNSWKAFARQVEKASGVCVWSRPKHGRGRQRRDTVAVEVAASRRRAARAIAAQKERAAVEREAERRRVVAAVRAAADDRRVRDVTRLMTPGWGR